jgi:hypothetical protein
MTVLVILKINFNFCERIFAAKQIKIQAGKENCHKLQF